MKAITLQIAMRQPGRGDEGEDVLFPWTGYDFGVPGLAASSAAKLYDGKPKRRYRLWVIVHLSSGCIIGPKFSSRAAAAGVGLELGELPADWTCVAEEIRNNPDLIQAGKYIVYGGVRP